MIHRTGSGDGLSDIAARRAVTICGMTDITAYLIAEMSEKGHSDGWACVRVDLGFLCWPGLAKMPPLAAGFLILSILRAGE
jgi:hypothetical protein